MIEVALHAGQPRQRLLGDICDPDQYLRALLIEGLIKDLQNACLQSEGRVQLVDVRARLGPLSTIAWDSVMRIWHGPAAKARKILPPGSLPESRRRG